MDRDGQRASALIELAEALYNAVAMGHLMWDASPTWKRNLRRLWLRLCELVAAPVRTPLTGRLARDINEALAACAWG